MADTLRVSVTVTFCSEGGEREIEELTFSDDSPGLIVMQQVRWILTQLRDAGALQSFTMRPPRR